VTGEAGEQAKANEEITALAQSFIVGTGEGDHFLELEGAAQVAEDDEQDEGTGVLPQLRNGEEGS
jgi:hypothetical protein